MLIQARLSILYTLSIAHCQILYTYFSTFFRNPYPRPVNLPPGSYTTKEGKRTGTRIERLNEMSKPIYVKSIDDSVENTKNENG